MSDKLIGKVTRVLIKGGYGFLEGQDKRDYFFHMKEVDPAIIAFRNLSVGTVVEFTPAPAKAPGQCLQATKLSLISPIATEVN